MRALSIALFVAGAVFWTAPAFAYTSPGAPRGYVNDFAQVLSSETVQTLSEELRAFDATTSTQIAVVTVPDMGGDYIENYAVRLFEEWKIGTSQNNNGVLLVIAVAEHKLRIEVGYGLEGALPDSTAQRILDAEMTPYLRQGNYDTAVIQAVRAIKEATQGEYSSAPKLQNMSQTLAWLFENGWLILFGGSVLLQWLASIFARSKSWWAGGIVGAFAGVSISWFVAWGLAASIVSAVLLGILGLVFDYIVSSTYRTALGHGSTPPWWTGGGGLGGRSGGGFGGFGGGRSGGGGASGGW